MKFASPGTVSHGTLLSTHLLPVFADALEALVQANAKLWCSDYGRARRDRYLGYVWDAREIEPRADLDATTAVVERLMGALDSFSPPGHLFGAHPGDGADFGYWPQDSDDE